MADLTTEQVLTKYQAAMSRPSTADNYKKGIQGYQGNPMELAAAAQDKWADGVMAARDSGKFRRKLLATPREVWANNAVNYGAGALSNGAKKAAPKMARSLAVMVPAWNSIKSQVKNMANISDADKMARVQASWDIQRAAAKNI